MPDPSAGEASASREVLHRLGPYEVVIATDFGPRILGLSTGDGLQLLIRLPPEVAVETAEVGTFRFRGGHRLWASPEVPAITYAPDDDPCTVTIDDGRVVVTAPVDRAGFVKQLSLRADGDRLIIDHILRWHGSQPVEVAPWAITQLPLGGTAILPLRGVHRSPLQADRSLVLWPYTRPDDPRLDFGARSLQIRGMPAEPLKVGAGPAPGGLGYLRDGWLFSKRFEAAADATYPDRGAVAQVYCDHRFIELESVGPLQPLEPGAEARHREVWEVTRADLASALVASEHWGMG